MTPYRTAAGLITVMLAASVLAGCGEEITSTTTAGGRKPAPASKGATAANANANWPVYKLRAAQSWQLNSPKGERFDASGLSRTAKGDLLTINDRGPALYRIEFLPNTNAANLVEWPACFARPQLRTFARAKFDRYDAEGIAVDERQRIYMCEEADRWVLRCDPEKGVVERLAIDWTPVIKLFDGTDPNASLEGIAVGGGRLYVANERQMGRIIVVDLENLRILEDFSVRPQGSNARDVHYSDLSFFDGVLYALLRESYCVLAINPADHQVLAEYNYRDMEREPDMLYRSLLPTSQMEGLAVEPEFIWLVTDNNGTVRARHPKDNRPTLFKCPRPAIRR
jgi:hypothetical protein